jgi:hypothetical protein
VDGVDSAKINRVKALAKSMLSKFAGFMEPQKFATADQLVDWHFKYRSDAEHINREGLQLAIRLLRQSPALILETGTSAWGTDSSRLWDAYVRSFGGEFWTCDIRPEPSRRLGRMSRDCHFVVGDSVEFLSEWASNPKAPSADLVYLDSWDVDLNDPIPCMDHCVLEFNQVLRLTGSGSMVVIDDTPAVPDLYPEPDLAHRYFEETGLVPGKGAKVLDGLPPDFEVLYHHYNVVLRRI